MRFQTIFQTFYYQLPRLILRGISHSRTEYLFFVLMANVLAWTGNLCGALTDPFLSFLLPLFDFYLICLCINWLKRYRMGWIITLPITLLVFGEQFLVLFYHSHLSLHVIRLIAETNSQESSEFISSVLTHPSLWQALAITSITGAVAYGLGRLSRRPFRCRHLVLFLSFLLIVWSGVRQLSAYRKVAHCFMSASIAECDKPGNIPHLNTPVVRLLYGLAFNMAASQELHTLAQSIEKCEVDSCSFRCPLIVLVIGESYNKYHTPLYNNDYQPTTPRLSALQEQGSLFVHQDAVSPFNLTSNVFKYMFSTWDDDDEDSWTAHSLFPALFKKAGYRVYFLTNQFTMESNDLWNVVGGTIFNQPHLSELQFTKRNEHTYTYDHELLDELPPVDSLTATPTLLIVHLIGQHVRYDERFPADSAHFSPHDVPTTFGGEQGKVITAAYDNATYYNDGVVSSILQRFQETDAIGIYLSDHGEEVYDWRAQYERTNEAQMPPEVAHYQYEIPLFFYLSPRFQFIHDDITQQVQASLQKPFFSSDISNLMLYLGGIHCADYKDTKNLLSPHYDIHRKRILRNQIDYDELMKSSAYATSRH